MIRKIALALLFVAFTAVGAHAADFNGKWTAEFDTQMGVTAITEGKIDGDNITFVEALSMNGMDIKITYTGKIDGDTIKFTRKIGDFATEELTAKRVK